MFLLDVALFLSAYAGAYLVRMDLTPYPAAWHHFERTLLTLLAAKALVFVLAGTYRGIAMYATISDLLAIVRTATLASLAVLGLASTSCRATVPTRAACWSSTGCSRSA